MQRTALITGANRGIGYATAQGLQRAGLRVIIGARDMQAGQKAAAELGVEHVSLDVSDLGSIEAALSKIGPIDVLVNNAGVLGEGSVLESTDEFSRSMSVMVEGPFHLMRLATPAMVQNGYGRIVNVSSEWGAFSDGLKGPGAYGVAKAALNALTLSASRSLPAHVKVNAMAPGWVKTRMGGTEAPRTPEQGADTVVWLSTLPDTGPTGGFFRDRTEIAW